MGQFPVERMDEARRHEGYFPLLEFASREIGNKFQKQVLPLVEEALLGAPETRRREVVPEPARPKQERQSGHWSGLNSGPNDAYPDDEIPF
jgi:hypothetical protein